MRYIRTTTPANIYSLKPTFIVDRTDVTCFKTHGNKGRYVNDTVETEENLEKWLKYNNTSIIKQADTIEELCDGFYLELDTIPINERFFSYDRANEEFVGVDKTKCVFVVYKTSPIFQKMKGFIKTDKGLIYVAKMNDKGELELL